MKKKNNNYTEYIYIIVIFILVLIIMNLFFTEFTYCDDGSIKNTNVLLDTNDDKSININCLSVFYHYRNVVKRKVFWYTCVNKNQPIINYNDFKKYWDPDTNVSSEIKKELINKFYVQKNTFKWIIKPCARGRWSKS